jgi:hypothetical protein
MVCHLFGVNRRLANDFDGNGSSVERMPKAYNAP